METYIKKSCYKMVEDRGYSFVEESKMYSTFKKGEKPLIIIFSTDYKLNINNIKEYIQLQKKNQSYHHRLYKCNHFCC